MLVISHLERAPCYGSSLCYGVLLTCVIIHCYHADADDADDDDNDDDIEGAVHQTWWRPFKAAIPRLMKLLPTGKIILEFTIWQL